MRDIGCEDKCGDYVLQMVGCKMNSINKLLLFPVE